MQITNVGVLGVMYQVYVGSREEIKTLCPAFSDDKDGECYIFTKQIYIVANEIEGGVFTKHEYLRELVVHEISHAFIHESGLSIEDGGDKEELVVCWLQRNWRKINNALYQVLESLEVLDNVS